MGYIGSDPKTKESVSTSQLINDSVTNEKIVDEIKIIPVEYADEVLKIALTKELKKTEWVEVEISKKDEKSQASIQ